MATFYTSDLHFGHENIIKFEPRPWDSIPEMNDGLVERWNSVVTDKDTVYVLGDVVMGGLDNNLHHIGRLNGKKVMVSGNHDKTFYTPNTPETKVVKAVVAAARYRDAGFDRIFTGYAPVSVNIGNFVVLLSHFPYEGDSGEEDRYASARPEDRGQWLIHGHVHGKWRVNGRQINVGVDVWNGFPVREDTLLNIIKGVDTNTEPYTWEAI